MAGWYSSFLFAYLLGGITFIPLAIIAILLHAYLTFPHRQDADPQKHAAAPSTTAGHDPDSIVQPGDDIAELKAAQKLEKEEAKRVNHSSDVAAGYFAVCREYTPMGINAKPIERSTPVGSTTITTPSPSVYQAIYRGIFDRKHGPGPLDNKNDTSLRPKKAGNVFYVVLRHGHMMLFDDDEQIEVRHVISLAHHDISIYSGGDKTPEGELFIKRNALCLSRKTDSVDVTPDTQMSKPFYLFSENCSAKEDFYFAMMRNQVFGGEGTAPKPLQFEVKNIISLVQRLHSTEDHLQTRWLNAMIGRVFLGIYRTADLENLIRAKLTKKISRVKRPSFLSGITIQKIDTGDSAPYITNPRLKDLTVEGECGVEADVKYTGNFRIEVAATARIDLGSRFKAREVNLVLAVVLKKLEGHVHFKIKPPPSNRIWFSFQQMPKMEMAVEPIVSSRQITYTVILRQIESKIKEVVAETLVLPFWDDIPFFDTEHKKFRGGIWEGDDAVHPVHDFENAAAQDGDVDEVDRYEESGADMPPIEKSASLPVITEPATGLFGRKLNGKTTSKAASSAIDIAGANAAPTSTPPRPIRSGSFTNPPTPTTGTDATNADVFRPSSSPPNESLAAEAMAHLSARTTQNTESETAQPKSPHRSSVASQKSGHSSISSRDGTDTEKDTDTTPRQSRRDTVSSSNSSTHEPDHAASSPSSSIKGSIRSQTGSITRGLFSRKDANQSQSSVSTANSSAANNDLHKRTTTALAAMSNAATSAKRWGISALQRHAESGKDNNHPGSEDTSLKPAPLDLSKPMGGGRPFPPPGQPLPMPEKGSKVTTIAPPPRKKSSPPPLLPDRPAKEEQSKIPRRPVPKPPLPKRRTQMTESPPDDGNGAGILVVEAPMDSEPTTPITPVTPSLGDMVSMHLRDGAADLKDDALEGDESTDSDKKSLESASKKAEQDSPPALPSMPPPPTVEDDDDDGLAAWMEHDEQLAEPGATVVTSEGMAQ